MAPNSMFSKCFRFARVFRRNGQPMDGLTSHFGLQKQLFCTRVRIPAGQDICGVSYLVNSWGLSPVSATLVSHKVKLRSLDKPDSVLALLKQYEFSETQISDVVRRDPLILKADVKKTLLPKFEFLSSIGMSRLDLAKSLSQNPHLLNLSLKNCIVSTYSFLKSVGMSDVKVVQILKHKSYIFQHTLFKNVKSNVELVRKLGMPQSCVARLLRNNAKIVVRKPELFSQLVYEVTEMGFDLKKLNFVNAIYALAMKETWKRCQEAYRRWGWSENQILCVFRISALCMTVSEKQIMGTMDFLVNKMGWESQAVAKCPYIFTYSLEKRIIPRFSVVKVLCLKGLIEEENLSLASVIMTAEKYFLNRFVNRHLSQVPQLLDVYRREVDIQDM